MILEDLRLAPEGSRVREVVATIFKLVLMINNLKYLL